MSGRRPRRAEFGLGVLQRCAALTLLCLVAVFIGAEPAATAQNDPQPLLEIVKTVLPGPLGACPGFDDGISGLGEPLDVAIGTTVTYCISVRNSGQVDLIDVEVFDDQAPDIPLDVGHLPSGVTTTRSYDVEVDFDTVERNVAEVFGLGAVEPFALAVDSDAAGINVLVMEPILQIVKTVVPGPNGDCPASFDGGVIGQGDALRVEVDEFVTYCVAVKNVGDGDAVDVAIRDAQAPNDFFVGDLASGESYLTSYDVQIGLSTDLLNTAVVTGSGLIPDIREQTESDTSIVELIDPRVASIELIHSVSRSDEPCLTVAKNLNSLVADAELLPVTWCFKVTNTGNVPLTNMILEAPDASDEDIVVPGPAGATVLLPGESVAVETTGAIPDTGLISRAGLTGEASDAQGNPLVGLDVEPDVDNATVVEASIQLDMTVAPGPEGDCNESVELLEASPGATVTWCYAITNTGSTVLQVDEIENSAIGLPVLVPPADRRLPITATLVVTTDSIVDDSITGNAVVRGQPIGFADLPLNVPPIQDADSAVIDVPFVITFVDADCNGLVDGRDALVIAQFVAGTRAPSSCPHDSPGLINLQAADVTRDGDVLNDDVQALLDCLVAPDGCG